MMRFKLLVVLGLFSLGLVSLIGCSKSSDNEPSDGIPSRLNFTPQAGAALTARDWEDIKAVVEESDSQRPSSFLIKEKEYSGRLKQENKFNAQSAKYRNTLTSLQNRCVINQPSTQNLGAINPNAGQNHASVTVTSSISGGCPVQFSSSARIDFDLLRFNREAKTGLVNVGFSLRDSELVTDETIQEEAKFISGKNIFDGSVLVNYLSQEHLRMYGKMTFDSTFETFAHRKFHVLGGVELLGDVSSAVVWHSGEITIQLQIKGFEKPLLLSAHSEGLQGESATFAVYVNGRLSDAETSKAIVKMMSSASNGNNLAVNSDGRITISGLSRQIGTRN